MEVANGVDQRTARLAAPVRTLLKADSRRIAIVGTGGWIGRSLLALLEEALGQEECLRRVCCYGSTKRIIETFPGHQFPQQPLDELAEIDQRPTLLFHLAYLTKDKVGNMDDAAYQAANRKLSGDVRSALDLIGVDRLFVASSGAAAFAEDAHAAHDLRLYGALKREDERLFAEWANTASSGQRAAIGRIYNVSGPFINKHATYALASFILDALAAKPIEVRAPMRVYRGFVPVREVLSLIMANLLTERSEPVWKFETGGEPLELAELAAQVIAVLGGGPVARNAISVAADNRYCGDNAAYLSLLSQHGMTAVSLAQQIAETAAFLARPGQV